MPTTMTSPEIEFSEEMREIEEDLLRRVEELVIEDDTPVDNIFSEKEQRLLTESLYSSWAGPLDEAGQPRKFLALANVGLFPAINRDPLVPDMLLSLDVIAKNLREKRNRTYLVWEFGKLPEVVIEIVSNKKGGEKSRKLGEYARINIPYYIVHDPGHLLGDDTLILFEWQAGRYVRRHENYLPLIQLGVTLWTGNYQDMDAEWLRWCDEAGNLIPTGAELARREAERAQHEAMRAQRMAAKLRELGIDPEQI